MIANSHFENCASKNEQSEISFTVSNKGRPLLIHENHLFKCNKITLRKKYWSCIERDCNVYIHTSIIDEFTSITGDHNHSSNPDELETKLLRNKIKERILAETTSITRIYDEEVIKANLSRGAAAILPTVVEFRMYYSSYQ